MKKMFSLALIVMFAISSAAAAEVWVAGHAVTGDDYAGAKGLGIGIVLGEINGLSIKNWVSRNNAVQFDFNWDVNYGGLGFGAAYLIHNFNLIEADNNLWPLYFGIKGWAAMSSGTVNAGIQVPLGFAWIPRTAPIDIFVQFEPGISIIPDMHFAPGGGLGIRFWFG